MHLPFRCFKKFTNDRLSKQWKRMVTKGKRQQCCTINSLLWHVIRVIRMNWALVIQYSHTNAYQYTTTIGCEQRAINKTNKSSCKNAGLQSIVFLSIAQSNSNSVEVLHYCNMQYCNRSKVLHYCAIVLQ